MKKKSKVYYILSYIMFILAPFIAGIVEIYTNYDHSNVHIISMIINVIVLLLISLVCYIFYRKEKIHFPDRDEQKQLLFGFIGNVIIFFYTFQNEMNIDDVVTIYLVLLLVLFVHYLLIGRKLKPRELWILLPIFLIADTLHLLYTGCGFNESYTCYNPYLGDWELYVLYSLVLTTIIGYYIYQIYLLKPRGFFKYSNMILVLITAVLMQFDSYLDEKVLSTLYIILPFLMVVNFIIRIVNKTYNHKLLLFYIRTFSILFIFAIMSEMDYFYGDADREVLIIMVAITYVSFGCSLLPFVLKVDMNKSSLKNIVIKEYSDSSLYTYEPEYNKIIDECMNKDMNAYILLAIKEQNVIGIITTTISTIKLSTLQFHEARINKFIVNEMKDSSHVKKLMIEKLLSYYQKREVNQITVQANRDSIENIQIYNEMKFALSSVNVNEVIFVKTV